MVSPTAPAACRPAVVSVAVRVQAAGCGDEAAQTLTFKVVGLVPETWNRTLIRVPGAKLTPARVSSESIAVTVAERAYLVSSTATPPAGVSRMRASSSFR